MQIQRTLHAHVGHTAAQCLKANQRVPTAAQALSDLKQSYETSRAEAAQARVDQCVPAAASNERTTKFANSVIGIALLQGTI
eukprot:9697-Heterococcus_DN1.PRE.4